MEIEHIREFLTLAETCNYGEAADRLFLSQSALFKHIKSLETELGSPLFSREGKHITLTNFGQLFLSYAIKTVTSHDLFMRDAEVNLLTSNNTVLIGTQYLITSLISDFRRHNNKYVLRVITGNSVEKLLYDYHCELAFIRNVKDPEEKLISIPYTTDTLAVVMHPSHPLASKTSIHLEELRNESFIAISPDGDKVDQALDCCIDNGFYPKVVLTTNFGNEVTRLVAQNAGIALLQKKVVLSEVLNDVVVIDLDPPVEYNISLCYRKDIVLSPGAEAVVTYIRNIREDS